MKMLEKVANYMQKKYNSDIAKMIKNVEHSIFEFRVHPVPKIILNPDGTTTQEKVDKMEICMWKKDYE